MRRTRPSIMHRAGHGCIVTQQSQIFRMLETRQHVVSSNLIFYGTGCIGTSSAIEHSRVAHRSLDLIDNSILDIVRYFFHNAIDEQARLHVAPSGLDKSRHTMKKIIFRRRDNKCSRGRPVENDGGFFYLLHGNSRNGLVFRIRQKLNNRSFSFVGR